FGRYERVAVAGGLSRPREIGLGRGRGAAAGHLPPFRDRELRHHRGGRRGRHLRGARHRQGRGRSAGWKVIMTVGSILVSVGVSAGVGLAFGIYSALRAARLNWIRRFATGRPRSHTPKTAEGVLADTTLDYAARLAFTVLDLLARTVLELGRVVAWHSGKTAPRLTQNTDKLHKNAAKTKKSRSRDPCCIPLICFELGW